MNWTKEHGVSGVSHELTFRDICDWRVARAPNDNEKGMSHMSNRIKSDYHYLESGRERPGSVGLVHDGAGHPNASASPYHLPATAGTASADLDECESCTEPTVPDWHPPTAAEFAEADTVYQLNLEAQVHRLLTCFKCDVGQTLIQEGAVGLAYDPAYFDDQGRITAFGVDALVDAGMAAVWRKWSDLTRVLQTLTRADIDVMRESQAEGSLQPRLSLAEKSAERPD